MEISNPGNQTNTAGDEVGLQLQTTDTNGGTVLYSATGLPSGVYINPYTGFIFGTIASTAVSGTRTRQRSMLPTAAVFLRSVSTGP